MSTEERLVMMEINDEEHVNNVEKEFSYGIPDTIISNAYILKDGQLKFEPNLQEQRIVTAIRVLEDEFWNTPFRKVSRKSICTP